MGPQQLKELEEYLDHEQDIKPYRYLTDEHAEKIKASVHRYYEAKQERKAQREEARFYRKLNQEMRKRP